MKTVFVDVDTQIDFLFPAGALYVPGAERLLPAIARLNHFAAAHGIPLISTADAHSENDPEFRAMAAALRGRHHRPVEARRDVGWRGTDHRRKAGTWMSSRNPEFRPPCSTAWKRIVTWCTALATDYCVRCAVTGLLATGKPVSLVTDAIAAVNPEDGARALAEFTARGGHAHDRR